MTGARKAVVLTAASAVLAGGLLAAPSAVAAESAAPRAACTGAQLSATGAQRTGSTVRVTVVNKGPACELRGFPTVAVAGQGAPDRNKPLGVSKRGPASTVKLAPGKAASTVLTFTPVLGEADGYCASGADPFVAPTLVVGVAGARFQLAPSDGGQFALCGNNVGATAFR